MKIKGFTYGYDGKRGDYRTAEAALSVERLAALGGDWAALAFTVCQDTYHSTQIRPDYRFTVTDRDVAEAVTRLRGAGLKVCMKPIVNCLDGVWRASVGCEMLGTEKKEELWRQTIAAVREIYHGPLVYNTNHGKEKNVRWWDAVDYIGTSAYFRVADRPGASMEEMKEQWDGYKAQLAEISRLNGGKQIIFMEIGCRSALGCAMMPYDFSHREFPYSEEEQANFYESCFRSVWEEPWFGGMFWWDWYTKLPETKPETGFSIVDKQAENIVKAWYVKA